MPKQRQVALVTGGAKRVGAAIVRRLASAGYDVAFTYSSSAAEAKQLKRNLKGHAFAIQADLTQTESACRHVYESVRSWRNRLDVLVNSASIYQPGDAMQRQMMAIHFESPLRLCRLFEKHLRKSRGHVINMVDQMIERPWPKYLAYCASKAALWNLTLSMARELAPEVTVNGIAPGVVEWPADFPKADQRKYLKRVPLARAGTPADVANLAHFLATEGSYINGQIIRLDGGRSIL